MASSPTSEILHDIALINRDAIKSRVSEVARSIYEEFSGEEEVLLIGILNGAFTFLSELVTQLDLLNSCFGGVTKWRVEFVKIKTYSKNLQTKEHKDSYPLWLFDTNCIYNTPVILVDDIADTAFTLDRIKIEVQVYNPLSISTCVLIDKPTVITRHSSFKPDWKCFTVNNPSLYLYGYGMDDDEGKRGLEDIHVKEIEIPINDPWHRFRVIE